MVRIDIADKRSTNSIRSGSTMRFDDRTDDRQANAAFRGLRGNERIKHFSASPQAALRSYGCLE
jgi:hypothetical protein